ncbi:MAG: biotin/lipoyl-binding protein [Clostridia bacterium]|nr:biotin/lipoyl-binding protein [Clostridia bacterium]
MKNYKVVVNGTAYQISVEEIDASEVKSTPATPVAAQAAPVSAPAGGEKVEAPMPGTILDVKVKEGQQVKAGEVLVILEAMKMENEILAPCDGTVTGLAVSNGASVESGAVICSVQ